MDMSNSLNKKGSEWNQINQKILKLEELEALNEIVQSQEDILVQIQKKESVQQMSRQISMKLQKLENRMKTQKEQDQTQSDLETNASTLKFESEIVIKSLDEDINQTENKSTSCKCKRSKCLRMYCECFSLYGYCGKNCSCENCQNLPQYDQIRRQTLIYLRDKYPEIKKKLENMQKQQIEPMSCNCKKSFCIKKYCECYAQGLECTERCNCIGCKNHGHKLSDESHLNQFLQGVSDIQIKRDKPSLLQKDSFQHQNDISELQSQYDTNNDSLNKITNNIDIYQYYAF